MRLPAGGEQLCRPTMDQLHWFTWLHSGQVYFHRGERLRSWTNGHSLYVSEEVRSSSADGRYYIYPSFGGFQLGKIVFIF
jgi:hypothetical protein